jgi:caa(3)-type oxidase subunit IV
MAACSWTLAALLALATASLLASRHDLGGAQAAVALGIAGLKAVRVALVFMGLARARASLRIALLVALLLTSALILLVAMDVATRQTSRSGLQQAGPVLDGSGSRP